MSHCRFPPAGTRAARRALPRGAARPFAPFVEALRPLGELRPEPAADAGAARLRRARELYDLALPYADRALVAGRAVCSWGSMHRCLGRLAVTLGRHDGACRHDEAAIAAERRAGASAWLVQARARLAEALGAAGDADGAEREMAAARAQAETLGLPQALPGAIPAAAG